MRRLHLLYLFLLFVVVATSCTSSIEEDDTAAPEYANLITGTYAYTTTENDTNTGSGTAIVSRVATNKIRIGLEDGVSFYAHDLQKIDNDLVMAVPAQEVDFYGMDARFEGDREIARAGSRYDGVYFGSRGDLEVSITVQAGSQTDQVLLVLSR